MNEHTNRILERILTLLQDFRSENINLDYLVTSLEGSINALEEKLSSDFYTQWYINWGDLEQIRASSSEGLITETTGRELAQKPVIDVTTLVKFELSNSTK